MTSIEYLNESQRIAVDEVIDQFTVDHNKLDEIVSHFIKEMRKGLNAPVKSIPNGTETGTYLALDLGGTNLRVCQITFLRSGKLTIKQEKYEISDSLKTGHSSKLFDFIADCIRQFLIDLGGVYDSPLSLGFTFSFPVDQMAIHKGVLVRWTKGFTAAGAVGQDMVGMLREALKRKNVPVKIVAIVNDTTGTLLAHAYENPATIIGVIFGTGTNAAYVERLENIPKLDLNCSGKMVIDIEWGAFDNERQVLSLTPYDEKLDRISLNPGEQMFEKLISGDYLGKIVHNVLLDLVGRNLLFSGRSSSGFDNIGAFKTPYMSIIEADGTDDLVYTKQLLEVELKIPETTLTDRQIVQRICCAIGLRAARLSSCALCALIKHIGVEEKGCAVGIDGSLFEFHPGFKHNLKQTMREILGKTADNISLEQARDGSGVGAALAALYAEKDLKDCSSQL
ncbi:5587_t:CDS:2 [Paraglomus brasilianum]|uniref:Phosphotransferase n=1 Tax=Paraglomus brasilianum TaxID=144538 RepID=A0A9N9A734_9GLOM|nr:5587_t:CDS:2 [Paraglomus brasilianum]